ncbi:MAG: type VI secretion system tip protein TssI/VgrG [Alphaproteobacteria bacterium]
MADQITQDERRLSVESPLGADVLLISGFSGTEGLSQLFDFRLDLLSATTDITPDKLLGKSVTVKIDRPGGDPRYFNGVVRRFAPGAMGARGLRSYVADIVPTLWLLTQTADHKIFQEKTAKDIIEDVLKGHDVTNYRFGVIKESHPTREYCVQYGETAFAFVQRLMEEEGIFFFIEHKQGEHTIVIADDKAAYVDCADAQVELTGDAMLSNAVSQWQPNYRFQTGKWTQRDFDFEQPGTVKDLQTEQATGISISAFSSYERFQYPGLYVKKTDGTLLTRLQMETVEAGYHVVDGASDLASFVPGAKIKVKNDPDGADSSYVLTAVSHTASGGSLQAGGGGGESYANGFSCIPADVVFRPPRLTPKPMVHGPQTAIVVGQSGQEIFCDKYGRIKVQFHWDRYGKSDENSSCWIRVAQAWAGAKWGTIFTPRVGMEVVVEFLDGDPDRPLVTGCVYNGDNGVPYTLADNKTQSGVLTRSSTGGAAANANELRFEDKKGSEEVFFHAEKDFKREVENDDTLTVDHDRKKTIKNDETIEVQGNRTDTVKKDETVTIEGNRTKTVKKDDTLTVDADRSATVKGKDTTTVTGDTTVTVSSGNFSLQASAGQVTIEAAQSIELKVGGNSVKIDPSGVTINGTMVKASGSASVTVEGSMTKVAGSGMLQLQGGLVKVN